MKENETKRAVLLKQRAKRRFGQHFLISERVIARTLEAAGLSQGDKVVEIGPGLGALTVHMLDQPIELLCVELDSDLVELWKEAEPSLNIVHEDALRVDWSEILVDEGWKCVSNLPYNVGTPILSRLLVTPQVAQLVVMLQKEVVERLIALPSERKRGSLSCWAQSFADVEFVCRVPPGAFSPPPKVESAVVKLTKKKSPLICIEEAARWERFLRCLFAQPRKMTRNNLKKLSFISPPSQSILHKRPFQLEQEEVIELYACLAPEIV